MKNLKSRFLLCAVLVFCLLPACSREGGHQQGVHGHGHHDHHGHGDEAEKGPHGGRLLSEDDFQVEIVIFEEGIPPEYHIYAYGHGKLLKPSDYSLSISLTRLGGIVDKFSFSPSGEYLKSRETVNEPHSFDVLVEAVYEGKTYNWEYPSYEGRTELSSEAIAASGIESMPAGPASIRTVLKVNGQLTLNENRLVHVIPRFPGVAKQIAKELGDSVAKDDLLAVIESNQSLQPYEIRSQISGTVIKRHLAKGEFAPEGHDIFVVADLSELWADFRVYRQNFSKIKIGQKVLAHLREDSPPIEAIISYISPFGEEATQSRIVRAVIPNREGLLYPGLFISGEIILAEVQVPIAVKDSALQNFRDWTVVFAQFGNVFEIRPLVLGRSDGEYHEVLEGIEPGVKYVHSNSFILKADILKHGASHDH